MSCDHGLANNTCSQCDPYIVQNIRAERDKAIEVLGRALWNAGPVRMAHDAACPIAPGTKYVGGKVIGESRNEADCNCWVRDARAIATAERDR